MTDESSFWQEIVDRFVKDSWGEDDVSVNGLDEDDIFEMEEQKNLLLKIAPETLNTHLDQVADMREVIVCRIALLQAHRDSRKSLGPSAGSMEQELRHYGSCLFYTQIELHSLMLAILDRDGGPNHLTGRMLEIIECNTGITRGDDLQLLCGDYTVRQLLQLKPYLIMYF